jgi:CRP-like cAMP-binding protein
LLGTEHARYDVYAGLNRPSRLVFSARVGTQSAATLHSGERQPNIERGTTPSSAAAASLAMVLPDILANVPAGDRDLAAQTLSVPLVSARNEDLAEVISTQIPDAFDFLIVEGVVIKQTVLHRRAALELLGAGDVLAPPLTAIRQLESRAQSRYLAHGPVSLAALETHFRLAARRWPGIADFLHDRLGQQTHRASMHLAMLHQPRVEDRITTLFADLAERFGRMSGGGILVDLPLTHDLIGGLVGSRRPTVTLALQKLSADGMLKRHGGNRWTLAPRILSA